MHWVRLDKGAHKVVDATGAGDTLPGALAVVFVEGRLFHSILSCFSLSISQNSNWTD
jgi:sugar/nucleoside kinase (ribokinase family)